jgi:hypothetical protein
MKTSKDGKNIFQICIGLNCDHPRVKASREKMLDANPDYNYIMIKEEVEMDNFVKESFLQSKIKEENEWAEAYFKLDQVVKQATKTTLLCAKIDVARLMLIYRFGGLYIDMDSQFYHSLSKIVKDSSCVIFTFLRRNKKTGKTHLAPCPDQFFCKKNNILYKEILSKISSNVSEHIDKNRKKIMQIVGLTGPAVIERRLVSAFLGKETEAYLREKLVLSTATEGKCSEYKNCKISVFEAGASSRSFTKELFWGGQRDHWHPAMTKIRKEREK